MRYSVLRSEMTNITDAILSTALKSLINDGIVERRQYEEVPLRVEYSLSEKGWSLVPVISRTYANGRVHIIRLTAKTPLPSACHANTAEKNKRPLNTAFRGFLYMAENCRAYSRFIIFMVFIVLSEKPCMCRRLSTASVIKL